MLVRKACKVRKDLSEVVVPRQVEGEQRSNLSELQTVEAPVVVAQSGATATAATAAVAAATAVIHTNSDSDTPLANLPMDRSMADPFKFGPTLDYTFVYKQGSKRRSKFKF